MLPQSEAPILDTIAAESEKFTSPLLFVHGLWANPSVWRKFMGYCAHRGWTCHALHLPRRGAGAGATPLSLAEMATAVASAAGALATPPVLIGHDLGGLLVLTGTAPARAVVALTPLWRSGFREVNHHLAAGWKNRIASIRGRPVVPNPGRWRDEYMPGADCLGFVVPESPRFLRAVREQAESLILRTDVPTLIVGAERDRFAAPDQLRQLADRTGAEIALVADAMHALPWDRGWERTVATVHRWIVKSIGEGLLVERDEEDEGDE